MFPVTKNYIQLQVQPLHFTILSWTLYCSIALSKYHISCPPPLHKIRCLQCCHMHIYMILWGDELLVLPLCHVCAHCLLDVSLCVWKKQKTMKKINFMKTKSNEWCFRPRFRIVRLYWAWSEIMWKRNKRPWKNKFHEDRNNKNRLLGHDSAL